MKTEVLQTIRRYDMPVRGRRVIVALSGGSDSMSLLHVMNSLKDELGFTLEAAHVNHNLRGKDAQRDEAFVREACGRLGIECHVLSADVNAVARKEGMSVEQAGRKVRYDFFASLGDDAVIATAHNLNDRIETMLFNLARGSSLKGLCSIPPVRGNIIRPLIACGKDEILAYCERHGIEYVTDDTNSDVKYSRNRIRANVLPELKKINPSFEECAGRCISNLNEDEEYLCRVAQSALKECEAPGGYCISKLAALPLPVLRRAVDSIIKDFFGFAPESTAIDDVISAVRGYDETGKGRFILLPQGFALRTRAGLLEEPGGETEIPAAVSLEAGENRFGGFTVIAEYNPGHSAGTRKDDENRCVYLLDRDKIRGAIQIRARASADSFSPAGRGVTKQLRKLQNERQVPPEIRDSAPVIADEEGIIAAWMCGVDERVRVTADSADTLQITILRGDGENN